MASPATERYLEHIKAKFFRTEGRSHLHVVVEDAPNESLVIHWTFTFDDMGSFHTLSGTSVIEMPELFGPVLVDGQPFYDIQEAETAIFGRNRFSDYIEHTLYDQASPASSS